jgi:hypothetical protein
MGAIILLPGEGERIAAGASTVVMKATVEVAQYDFVVPG